MRYQSKYAAASLCAISMQQPSPVARERELAAVDVQVQQRVALDDGPGHAADVVALRRLDLDDVGAEVGQMGRDLARSEQRALDDPHPVQQAAAVRHGGGG